MSSRPDIMQVSNMDSPQKLEWARNCPICDGRAEKMAFPYGTIFNGTRFFHLHCEDCGSTFVSPIPTLGDFAKMYSRENYHDTHYDKVRLDGHYADSIKFLTRYAAGRKSVLDFGCGNGSFLIVANDNGFRCTGIEFEPSAIANAHEKSGLEVIPLEEALATRRRFDIIHLGDVLEHLPDPFQTIQTLRSLLAKEGIFYIEGPLENHPSLVSFTARTLKAIRRALGNRSPGATPPTHLFRVNALNQANFFTDRLGYKQNAFCIYENGWPYLSTAATAWSPSRALKEGIARTAILSSTIFRFGSQRIFGNRFRSIFQPPLGQEEV